MTAVLVLCSAEDRCHRDKFAVYLREYLAVHFVHKLPADIQSQTASANVFGICAAPKALENMRKLVIVECASAVSNSYQNPLVIVGEQQINALSVAVF